MTELENAKWIVEGIRESLEKIREAQKESEWFKSDLICRG